MAENYDNRYVPATTRDQEKTTHTAWKLTKSQYLFYYWLLGNSNWSNGEQHYYIYDKDWTKKDAAEACGISERTIERALTVLKENGIIRRSSYAKAYEIYWPYDSYVGLNKKLILALIATHATLNAEMLIKVLSLLLYAHNKKLDTFTIVDLEMALGIRTGITEHVQLTAILGLLEHWRLLKLSQTQKQIKGINYIEYGIEEVHSNMDGIENYIPQGDALKSLPSQWKQLLSEVKPLLGIAEE